MSCGCDTCACDKQDVKTDAAVTVLEAIETFMQPYDKGPSKREAAYEFYKTLMAMLSK